MTIDVNSREAVNLTEISQDLSIQPDVVDRDNGFDRLDDETIIWRFARGKKRLVVNHNLRIDYAHNSLQLSTPNNELIAIHKIAEKLHYILVKKDSKYSKNIQNIISECQFIPIDTATSERGFVRYQKYEIPQGYTLRYEPAKELLQTWQEGQQSAIGLQLDILILARLKWYRVQEMICTDDRLDLQTRLGLISLSLQDRIAWIVKPQSLPTKTNADLNPHQNIISGGTDSDILGKIISKLAIEGSPNPESILAGIDLPFDSTVTMTQSGFRQSHDSSLLYEDDRSSTLTGGSLTPISEQLRASVINVLEDYLEHGQITSRTEVTTDAQGNVISEKTVTTHRSCPRWVIEAIINWN
jgi:hypothetical protein